MALLVVVVLVMLIALGAYRFSFYMESQYRLTRLHDEQVHARLAAISGLELAAAIVAMPPAQRMSVGGLVDNAVVFRDIAVDASVTATESNRDPNAWRFCLVSPRVADEAINSPLSASQIVEGPGASYSLWIGERICQASHTYVDCMGPDEAWTCSRDFAWLAGR